MGGRIFNITSSAFVDTILYKIYSFYHTMLHCTHSEESRVSENLAYRACAANGIHTGLLSVEISAPRPARCIHWRVGTEGWILAYCKKDGMNSAAVRPDSSHKFQNSLSWCQFRVHQWPGLNCEKSGVRLKSNFHWLLVLLSVHYPVFLCSPRRCSYDTPITQVW